MNLKHIICLGYPFKHPDMSDEPERYKHLAEIKTPMLIFQGVKDKYGGLEVQEKYTFSKNIELRFVDTNHNFDINKQMAYEIFQKIENVVRFSKT